MKEPNYCSLEASKRLVDAGIAIKTDMFWMTCANSPWLLRDNRHGADEYYPAPTFAEIWVELPAELVNVHKKERLFLDAWKNGDLFVCCYDNDIDEKWRGVQKHKNPADAVAELLIWVKEQNYERIKNTLIDRANKLKW